MPDDKPEPAHRPADVSAADADAGAKLAPAPDSDSAPMRIPITGELDLHTFAPRETARVVDAYLEACGERGIFRVRIVHGKGTGALRETVHALLRRSPRVESFRLGDETSGGWGATLVSLRPPAPPSPR